VGFQMADNGEIGDFQLNKHKCQIPTLKRVA
jgi:hypothetical protein